MPSVPGWGSVTWLQETEGTFLGLTRGWLVVGDGAVAPELAMRQVESEAPFSKFLYPG